MEVTLSRNQQTQNFANFEFDLAFWEKLNRRLLTDSFFYFDHTSAMFVCCLLS